MNRYRVLAAICFAIMGLIATGVGCSSAGEVCDGTGQCACKTSCSRSCDSGNGANCQFTCAAGQSCNFTCAGGNCRIACEGDAVCNVDCPKGGCTVATGTGATDVKCGGTETCIVGCDAKAPKCNVDGKPANGGVGGTSSGSSGAVDAGGIPGFDF